jgi:hypothetical protein
MTCGFVLFGISLCTIPVLVAQSGPTLILGISEPPELRGMPRTYPETSPADAAFWDVLKQSGKGSKDANLPLLNKFIIDYPTYGNAYYWRANTEACGAKPADMTKAKADLEVALSNRNSGVSIFD